ncbi:hypothetical protein A4W93_26670 [Piscinibacter gummiphilus]|uniref:Uncharacterized protein n=2 Tax=Piscinibacter gummiphilus TaxID=946333 RepID=A0A1W6LG33_9BURK|nr:hypothetical protein A4W93_26670 [Piscinibacter gummiphilus]ATU67898.1 hypothetical protein CPZ87_26800 [Piscinibacter gummiphilus]
MDPAVLRDRWGFLSTLAGKTYVNQRDGRTTIAQWRWEVPGLVLNERRYYPLPEKSYGIPIPQVFRYDVASQQLVMRGMFGYIQSDGSIVAVTDLALSPDDHFVPLADGYSVIEEKRGRGAPKVFRPFDPSRLEEYLAYDHEARRMRQAEREAFWNSVGQGLAAASQAYADTRPGSKAGAANPAGKANAGPAGTSSLPTLTAQFSYQCAYGSRIDVAIPYKTPACLAVKKEFTKTFACNDVDRMAGAAAACQQACGNRACDER